MAHRPSLADYKLLLRIPSYVLNTAAMAAMTFAIGGAGYWIPKYVLFRRFGPLAQVAESKWKPQLGPINLTFGIIMVVSGLSATLLGGWAGDKLRDRFPGSYFLVSAVSMIAGFGLFLLMLITPFPWIWGVVFLAVFCLFFNTGPSNTALANVTHPAMRSTAFALNILVIHGLGDAISPPIIGAINDHYRGDMNMGFLAVSGAMLVGGVLWLWGAQYLAADTAAAPHQFG